MQNISSLIGVEAFINEHKKHINNFDVLLAEDVARLFDISLAELHKIVNRNKQRFPKDFMFKIKHEKNKTETLAFTIPGIFMLSGRLKSEKAIKLSIQLIEFIVAQKPNLAFDMINSIGK